MAAAVVTVTASCKILAAKKRRMIWLRTILQSRAKLAAYSMPMEELQENDAGKYQEFVGLTVEDFDRLLSKMILSDRHAFACPYHRMSVFPAHVALINGFLGI